MRRVLEPDHDLMGEDEPPRDLVLGMPALLGIFLAVVLVCAVCFGFGYSSGHGFHLSSNTDVGPLNGAQTPPSQPSAAPPSADSESGSAAGSSDETPAPAMAAQQSSPESAPTVEKPNPGMAYTPGPAVPQTQRQAQAQPAAPSGVPVPLEAPGIARGSQAMTANSMPRHAEAPLAVPAVAAPLPATATDAENLSLMVQIAAVTQAADAETLSVALRHDGFAAVVRTTTGDPYFHVQVGPFTSYAAAKAVRERLASSGYTAFIRH